MDAVDGVADDRVVVDCDVGRAGNADAVTVVAHIAVRYGRGCRVAGRLTCIDVDPAFTVLDCEHMVDVQGNSLGDADRRHIIDPIRRVVGQRGIGDGERTEAACGHEIYA